MTILRYRRVGLALALGVLWMAPAAQAQDDPWQGAENQEQMLDTARGEAALAEAREHETAGRWQRAADKYAEAAQLLPASQEARDGLARMRALMNEGSTIGATEEEIQRRREQALIEFENAMTRAQSQLAQGDYGEAERETVTAQVRLTRARDVLNPTQFEAMRTRATEMLASIEIQREKARLAREAEELEEAENDRRTREILAANERQRIVNENLRRVRQLQMELKYREALQVLDEILFIDELNPAALALRDIIRTNISWQEYVEVQRQKERGMTYELIEGQKATIPPQPNRSGPGLRSTTGIMQYPEDWPQLTRQRTGEGGFQMTAADRAVDRRLAESSIPIDFNNNTLEQVVAFLNQVSGLNIYVDWKALEFSGVDRTDEISLQLSDVSLRTALDRVLDQLGEDVDRPQWDIQDGILVISSDEALRKRTVTIVYDIRDLLFEVPYFDNAPELDLDSALNQGGGVGGGGGGGGGFGGGGGGGFGGGGGGGAGGGGGSIFGDPGDDPERRSREELIEQIVTIIQENIDPEGWRDLGGETGTLQELNGNLIITNTPRNHQGIDGLLSQLREIRALQINVEGRFLEVNSDWFEQIGVDLDIFFNTNDGMFDQLRTVDPTAQLSDFFTNQGRFRDPLIFGTTTIGTDDQGNNITEDVIPFGSIFGVPDATNQFGNQANIQGITYVTQPVGAPIRQTDGFSPIPFVQNSFSAVAELAELTQFGATAIANPALVTGFTYLDDIQVDLLVEATQADNRSLVLTAPRLTLFNGQRAWVAVTTSTAFVSGLQAVTGDASGAFTPQIGQLREGFVLDVEAVSDASRRYVTMTVIASLAQNAGFRESDATEFGGAAGGSVGIIGGGAAGGFSGRIELPQITVSIVQTTVSVPDKGTILLGGQRFVNEIEVESGVPVLSKIPFINRFFTNRLTNKEERTLLILIRPEIIITQENEDILFPGLSDSMGSAAGSYIN